MKRFAATFSIFVAVAMMVAMMILPHHHHSEFLVIAHHHCTEAGHDADHNTGHHDKNSCEVNLFISSIIRDDIDKSGDELIPVKNLFSPFFAALSLLSNPVAPIFVEQAPLKRPPFHSSLFAEYHPAAQGLRAPPVV